jgi:hypothetical protein
MRGIQRTAGLIILLVINYFQTAAQTRDTGIQPVGINDFSPIAAMTNNGTDAVVLLDSGSTSLDANARLGFFTCYHRFRRLLIINKRALDYIGGTFSIGYYLDINGGKKNSVVKAFTYNLEKGRVIKTPVEDKDIFMEGPKDDYVKLKFAFPNARAGSIVEYDYTVNRYDDDLQDWYFQQEYPVLKSIYSARIPAFYNFHIVLQNSSYLTSLKRDSVVKTIESLNYYYDSTSVQQVTWTMENIPPMREEPFTSSLDNYIACVKFQLSEEPISPGKSRRVLNNWNVVSNQLLSSPDFGVPIEEPNGFISRQTKKIVAEADPEIRKARLIFEYVRDHYKVGGGDIRISEDLSLKEVFKTGIGNAAEINLLLIAMLRAQKITADPVILATRKNGRTDPEYPVLSNYNYLICRLFVDGKAYYLDAANSTLGFGKVSPDLYNGHARVITKNNFPVYLLPDSIRESTNTYAIVQYDSATKQMNLDWTQNAGYYESADIRSMLKNKSMVSYFKSITDTIAVKRKMDTFSIMNLDNVDEHLTLNYSMNLDLGNDELIYLNPLFNSGLKENPFVSAERNYPVELPYLSDNIYVLNLEIPPGFVVEELPKSAKILLNNTEGSYEYRIQAADNSIQLKSVIILNKATFQAEDYNTLRDFYAAIIKKQNEMVVLKRKN